MHSICIVVDRWFIKPRTSTYFYSPTYTNQVQDLNTEKSGKKWQEVKFSYGCCDLTSFVETLRGHSITTWTMVVQKYPLLSMFRLKTVYGKVGGLKDQNHVHVVVECPLCCSLTVLGSISFSMKYRFKVLVKIWLPASGKLTLLNSKQMVGTVHKIYRNKVYAVVKNACGGPRNKSHSFTSSLGMLKSEPRSRSSTSHTRVTSIVELLVFITK